MTLTEPLDQTHRESVAAVAAIRAAISRMKADAARWDLGTPPTRHTLNKEQQ
jgi:hypothetical protein